MGVLIMGGGMGGLFAAIALREAGVFTSVDVYEQTRTPSTAGAGLNIAPNGARLCKWLGIDLDGGDRKGPPRMYAGEDATAEFGDYHSRLAEKFMSHFCIGELA